MNLAFNFFFEIFSANSNFMLRKNVDNDDNIEILTNEKLKLLTTNQENKHRQYEVLYDRLINNRQRHFQQNYISLMIILNISVIILTIFRNELIVDTNDFRISRLIVAVICTALSICSIIVIILQYSLSMQIYNAQFSVNMNFFVYLTFKRLWFPFIVEVLINSIHPFPFLDKGMKYITMLIFLRLYPLFYSVTYFSIIYQNRDDVQNAIEKMGGYRVPQFTAFLGLKELMSTHSALSLIVIVLIVIPSFSYILYFSEKDMDDSKVINFGSTIYWGIITMTSVGYGDIYPSSDNPTGMIIACIAALSGTIFISILSGVIVSALNVTDAEQLTSMVSQRIALQKELRLVSAQIIQTAVRLNLDKGKNTKSIKTFFQLIIKKKSIVDQINSQMGYRDSFIAPDVLGELIQSTKTQKDKYNNILKQIMNIRTHVGITTNIFGTIPPKRNPTDKK